MTDVPSLFFPIKNEDMLGTGRLHSGKGQSGLPEDYVQTQPIHVFIFTHSSLSLTSLID